MTGWIISFKIWANPGLFYLFFHCKDVGQTDKYWEFFSENWWHLTDSSHIASIQKERNLNSKPNEVFLTSGLRPSHSDLSRRRRRSASVAPRRPRPAATTAAAASRRRSERRGKRWSTTTPTNRCSTLWAWSHNMTNSNNNNSNTSTYSLAPEVKRPFIMWVVAENHEV